MELTLTERWERGLPHDPRSIALYKSIAALDFTVGGDFFGSPIWVDGRLYCVSVSGELVVLEASDKFKVLDRYSLGELCRTTPAVALGKMFIRTEKHISSFGGTAGDPKKS